MDLPVCSGTAKLVQVVLRTRQYGSELSWLVTRRVGVSSIDAPNQLNIAMAGGCGNAGCCIRLPETVEHHQCLDIRQGPQHQALHKSVRPLQQCAVTEPPVKVALE
eukprot:GHRQ01025002.1.p1 GENE.GHRQ01025002.1~~GHRQ01025002.1.p1  ORF type:complete len:106 (-),score=9.01 GHRQ01025002.1:287-604(-)